MDEKKHKKIDPIISNKNAKVLMNVVKREKLAKLNIQPKSRNELVRKDSSLGIRGLSSFLPINSNNVIRNLSKAPRYQFRDSDAKAKRNTMGPPLEPPKSLKRKIIQNSTSSAKPDSSLSGRIRPRVLASNSGAVDSTPDFCTPRNRPAALRYISSSSRGGYSGTKSANRSNSTSVIEASVILAISEGRGMARGEIGIAAVDLRHPHLVLCQFSDTLLYTHTLTKINYFNPIEIIVPHTFCEGIQPSQLYQLIKEHFPTLNVTSVQRRHFNDAAGRQQIHSLCAPQYSAVYLQVLHKFYALTSAAAVLKYVEYIQCIVFARESLKIEYHSSENTMIIDVGTATQLELVQPLVPSAGPSCCLLGVLGPTYTVGGIRALRAAILQPSCNQTFIEARLDAVQDLIENDDGLMIGLQDVIKRLSDVDKILFLCMESPNQNHDKMGEAQLNQILLLKTTMELVPSLVEALNMSVSNVLRTMKMDFENPHYKEITNRIRNIIQEDAHLEKGGLGSLQRCFAVRPEINGLLDVARRTYSELIEDIQTIVEQLSETYDLPIRLNQNVLKGFHIVLPVAPRNRRNFKTEDLPEIFIQVHNNGASVSMTTEELVVLDQQAKESLNEIQKMSNIVISSLLKDLRPFMSSLYKLCENVAELDILLALAHASSAGSYIRPEFSDYLNVKNSVHPLLDYNSQTMPVPNDIYATPEHNFTIITGPNMGGKSIYIKQIAIMQIMAQLGSFVPATNAVLRLCDRVFSRIGFNDSVELNASTYVLEMKEIQHILQGLTNTSLVIIDELCRGTCTEEGTSIAWAICEELLLSEAFTFFTTHFVYLTRLQDLYFNVVNLQTTVTEENISANSQKAQVPGTQIAQRRLVYQHKIESGITKIERYGLALASKTNLPEETVKLAEELAELIIQRKKPQEIRIPEKKDEKLLYDLNAEIRKEERKRAPVQQIKQLIETFKQENAELIRRLKKERNCTESDTSAKSSDNNNIREIESSNIISDKVSLTNNPPRKPVEIVYSTSDMENDNDNITKVNSRRNIISPKPSRVIYSTTDDMEYSCTNEKENFTSVKSSNELLHTIFSNNGNNNSCINTDPQDFHYSVADINEILNNSRESLENEFSQVFSPNTGFPNNATSFNVKETKTNENDISQDYSEADDVDEILKSKESIENDFPQVFSPNTGYPHKSFNESDKTNNKNYSINTDCHKSIINPKSPELNSLTYLEQSKAQDSEVSLEDVEINYDDDDEFDIALALTQIIETENEDEVTPAQESNEDALSIDEDLVRETVNEINEDLEYASLLENIVLTPPMEFRD